MSASKKRTFPLLSIISHFLYNKVELVFKSTQAQLSELRVYIKMAQALTRQKEQRRRQMREASAFAVVLASLREAPKFRRTESRVKTNNVHSLSNLSNDLLGITGQFLSWDKVRTHTRGEGGCKQPRGLDLFIREGAFDLFCLPVPTRKCIAAGNVIMELWARVFLRVEHSLCRLRVIVPLV